MLIRRRPSWFMPESKATPEHVFLNRRAFLGASAGALALAVGGKMSSAEAAVPAHAIPKDDPTMDLYPAEKNAAFTLDRDLTDQEDAVTYNNFYEFGSHKNIWKKAQKLPLRPWVVKIDGLVEEEKTVDIDTLIRAMPLEERLYRHRCVEAWAMAVPWTGFPLRALLEYARPLGSAKYVQMQTFENPKVAPGQKEFWYPWPYTEGLTIKEAANDLAFLATGIYGHPLPPQSGAPLRLVTPWKYGFKSVKSIVHISFTDERPKTFWEAVK